MVDINIPWPIALMVLQHHERLDGTSYPQGLKGEEPLLGSLIFAARTMTRNPSMRA